MLCSYERSLEKFRLERDLQPGPLTMRCILLSRDHLNYAELAHMACHM